MSAPIKDLRVLNAPAGKDQNFGSVCFLDEEMALKRLHQGEINQGILRRISERARMLDSICLSDASEPYLTTVLERESRQEEPLIDLFGDFLSVLDATHRALCARGIPVVIPTDYILGSPLRGSDSMVEELKRGYNVTPTWRKVGEFLELYPIFMRP